MSARVFMAIAALALCACGAPHDAGGRYRQITNPPEVFCVPLNGDSKPEPGCGVMILDTETGNLFIHRASDWQEENPRTGKITIHDLNH